MILFSIGVGCKSETTESMDTENKTSDEIISEEEMGEKSDKYNEMVADGGQPVPSKIEILKDRPTGDGNYNWTFLTKNMLHYKNVIGSGGNNNDDSYKNKWVDLKDDGTYATGVNDKTSYEGIWMYDHPSTMLTLIPNPDDQKNSQWKVMFNEKVLVWVGTSRYGDNALQIRFIRSEGYPE